MKKPEPRLDALFKEIELLNTRFDDMETALQRLREDIAAQRTDHNWGLLHIFRKLGIKVSKAPTVGVSEELYEKAKAAILAAETCSTSYLQRTLGIGYARAARLVDLLEERGVIGPDNGGTTRTIVEGVAQTD